MGPKSVNYIDFNFYSKINSYDEQSYFWVCFQANNFFEFIIELETMLRFDISIFNIKKKTKFFI